MGYFFPLLRIPDGTKSANRIRRHPDTSSEGGQRRAEFPEGGQSVRRRMSTKVSPPIPRKILHARSFQDAQSSLRSGRQGLVAGDCSAFIMDLFRTFGDPYADEIRKNRPCLARVWTLAQGKPAGEKRRLLERAVPLGLNCTACLVIFMPHLGNKDKREA